MEKKKKSKAARSNEEAERMIEEMLLKHKEQSEEYERKRKEEEAAHTEAIKSYFSGGLNRLRPQASKTKFVDTDIATINTNIIGEDNGVSDSNETTNTEKPSELKSNDEEIESEDTTVIEVTKTAKVIKMAEVNQVAPALDRVVSDTKEKKSFRKGLSHQREDETCFPSGVSRYLSREDPDERWETDNHRSRSHRTRLSHLHPFRGLQGLPDLSFQQPSP